ncbi:glutathione S-transferase [Cognatishimia sp. WU-CL00825]|uniref:glutathione S-transferase family protein n=1 Tax=Cognatishimia sp. WU-CL00825 TaxID=3127658 RepID=UPI00310BEE60
MMHLHHVPGTRSSRILWLLEELSLDYELSAYQIGDGSLRTAEFLDRSPLGRVPALEINSTVIFESSAITQVLCEQYPDAGLAPSVGEADRAAYLQWLSYAETQASIVEALNLQMIFLRPPAKPSVAVLKLMVARLKATLGPLEALFGTQDWVLARGFSAADTMLGFNLYAVKHFVDLQPFPKLRAYTERCRARPAYQRAVEKDGAQKMYSQDFYPLPTEV